MKPLIFTSHKEYDSLNFYQRMLECYTAALTTQARCLDSMNYSTAEFRNVLDIKSVEDLFQLEHRYTSPDGSLELGDLIKELEIQRLIVNAGKERAEAEKTIRPLTVGVGPGATGVISGLISSIVNLNPRGVEAKNAEIIVPLPTYPLYDGLIKISGLKSVNILTKQENKFLATAGEVESHITKETIALILAYPNNPSFTTYDESSELKKIVELCQKNSIFLIADNIYQDLIFNGQKHIEIFSLTPSVDFIIKVFGLSKDRPFFTGHRIGYFIGDPILREHFFDYCINNYFCVTVLTKGLLALDLLFRISMGKNSSHVFTEDLGLVRSLSPEYHGVKKLDHHSLLQEINKKRLFETYLESFEYNQKKIRETLFELIDYVKHSEFFSEVSNDKIGNALFVKVNPEYYSGSDLDLFEELLNRKKIAVLPGNVFGMEIKPQEAWFRFTTTHQSKGEILQMLMEVENLLK